MNGRTIFWFSSGFFFLFAVVALTGTAWFAVAGGEGIPAFDGEEIQWLQRQAAIFLLVFFCLAVVLVQLLFWLDRMLWRPMAQLGQGMDIMATANPLHHLEPVENNLLGSLPKAARSLGEALFHAQRQVRESVMRCDEGIRPLEQVIKQLPLGLIIMDIQGHIILYNMEAQAIFHRQAEALGLGRTLYELLWRPPVETAIDMLARIEQPEKKSLRFFCPQAHNEGTLDCVMRSLMGEGLEQKYYLLTFATADRRLESLHHWRRWLHHDLPASQRPADGCCRTNERAGAEFDQDAMSGHGWPESVRQTKESSPFGRRPMAEEARRFVVEQWQLTDILTSDVMAALRRRMTDRSECTVEELGQPLWIRADAPAMVLLLETLILEIVRKTGVRTLKMQALMDNQRGYLDLIWPGLPMESRAVEALRLLPLASADQSSHKLEQFLLPHSSELSSCEHRRQGHAVLRISVVASPQPAAGPPDLIPERPEFYDFSLLNTWTSLGRAVGKALSGLNYVVFDTETTGLQPSKGDEIIAIAGVRIVNGRILSGETFERLVNPRRPIPPESTRIHGLTMADVEGQPTIEEILPQFKSFVGDSVLVAHNAAFDMRFLQLKEESSGVRLDRPVLDTLLLSVYLHNEDMDHTLDAIARRVGVTVQGRHTALGDTLVTAEVFIRLIKLLNNKGISTLGLAMRASESMVQIRRQQAKANY
ncbi:MAG: hypothetical protein HQL73_00600 [Magnetococcales bacterium]|nr:hypothetical protein [Magnetococcales bacterium]